MKLFEPYVQELEKLIPKFLNFSIINNQEHFLIENALNGQPSKVLRELVPISTLRRDGVFFTNRWLADHAAEFITSKIMEGASIYDPACGAGDLLLACARYFPISQNLEETLLNWNSRLKGADLFSSFIRATKIRLLLLAIERGSTHATQLPAPDYLFSEIQVRDTLITEETFTNKICIVINPPYTLVQAPKTCLWASGLVSQAALFLEKCDVWNNNCGYPPRCP